MIADEYFRVRADLGTALFFLQTLAHESHATREAVEVLQEASVSLREPFLFVALGAEKAGKSSLLNALFGRELCSVESPSPSNAVQLLKYGSREKEVPLSEGVLACYRPIFLLRDFTLADTPGGEIHEDGQRALAEQFLPRADLILFVLSVVDPWNTQAWERLQLLDQRSLRNLAIIVQQADLRNPVELDAVVEHLKQFALEKLSARVPVFATSAKMGYLAKTIGVDKARLLSESGMDRLEMFIDEKVTHGQERWGALRSVWQKSDAILRGLATAVRSDLSSIKQNERSLAGIESTLHNGKQQSLRQVNGELWSLSQLYERAQKRAEESLEQDLSFRGLAGLLFRGAGTRPSLQQSSGEEFVESVQLHVENFVQALKSEVGTSWKRLHETLPSGLAAQDSQRMPGELFHEDRGPMFETIAAMMQHQPAAGSRPEMVDVSFRGIIRWLRVAAIGGAVAVITFVFASGMVAVVMGAIAVAAVVWSLIAVLLKRREILRVFVTAIVNRREELLAPVEDYFRTAIETAYEKLTASFHPVQAYIAEQRSVNEPVIARVTELEATFVKCAGELGLPPRN